MDYERAKSLTSSLPDFNTFFESTVDIKNSKLYRDYVKNNGVVLPNGEILTADTSSRRMHSKLILNSAYNDDKKKRIASLFEELENERVIVFYEHVVDFDVLSEICNTLKRPISYINGLGKNLDNYNEKHNTVVLCIWSSGSRGHDLQLAKNSISFSMTNNPEFFDQHYARIKRYGQENICTYTFLLTPLEKVMYDTLKTGQAFSLELYEKWENEQ